MAREVGEAHAFVRDARGAWRELTWLLVAWGFIWAAISASLAFAYRSEVSRAYSDTERSAEKLASRTARTVDQVSVIALLVKHLYERDGQVDLRALGAAGVLGDHDCVTVSIADPAGKVVTSTHPFRDVSFADRHYFAVARKEPTRLILDPPVFGRIAGKWVIPAALAINDKDGTFRGIVLVSFAADILTRDFHHDEAADTLVAVIGDDGIVRSRRVGTQQSSGDFVDPTRLLHGPSSKESHHRTEPSVSPVSQVARFPTSLPVPGTNLLALVAVSADQALIPYRHLRSMLLFAGLLTSGVAFLVTLLIGRQARSGRAAAHLRNLEQSRHRATLDSIPAHVALVDAGGTIISVNEGWRSHRRAQAAGGATEGISESFNEARAQLYGGSPTTAEVVASGIRDVTTGASEKYVFEYEGLTGRWFRVTAAPASMDEGRYAVVTHVEITMRKTAEAALLRNQELHRMVCQVARIGGSYFDVRTNTLTLSEELRAIYELPPGQTLTVEARHALNDPEDRAKMTEAFECCVAQGVPYDLEIELTTVQGRHICARVIGHAVRDEAGQIVAVQSAFQDNTERKRIEAAAAHATAKLEATLESMSDGFCMLDKEWRFTYVNRETEWLFKTARGELIGEVLQRALPSLVGTELEARLLASEHSSSAIHCDEFLTPVGAWCEATIYPHQGGVAVYFRDTTDQRRAHQQLRLLETCVARMNDMVVVTESDPLSLPGPRIVFVNDAFVACSGFAREELIGRTPRLLQGPRTQRSELDRIAAALRAAKPVKAELINYTKGGREYWIEVDIVPVLDDLGRVTHFLSVERDITQRRMDQETLLALNLDLEAKVAVRTSELATAHVALVQREEETRSILENMADGVVCLDEDGLIRAANPMLETLLGYPPADLFGQSLAALLPNATLLQGNEECVGVHKSGEMVPLDVAFSSFDVKGRRMYTAILRDIRDRQRVLADLHRARAAAEESSQAKSAFVANMSHEIRTPMNGVIGMIDILQGTSLDREQRQMLHVAHESALSLLEIVESILDFSKIEAGKVEVEQTSMSVSDVAERVYELGRSIADKRNVRLSLYIDPAIPAYVIGDPTKVRQTLINLVSNAIKFSAGGRGEVSVRAVLRELGANAAAIAFTVVDNGIGMDEVSQAKLFQPFTQADASTTRRFGGTGLGLSIVHSLVGVMGGTVSVESELGQGSSFTVTLPFALGLNDVAKPKPEVLAHCVVLADSPTIDDVGSYLTHLGCTYELVSTVAAAKDALRRGDSIRRKACVVGLPNPVDIAEALRDDAGEGSASKAGFVALVEGSRGVSRGSTSNLVSVAKDGLTVAQLAQALFAALGQRSLEPVKGTRADMQGWFDDVTVKDVSPILIAEDNEINQKVITTQLSKLGYPTRLVDNGLDALEIFKCGEFSMLLTDLRMPGMDGFALAASIRSQEPPGRRMPIVALTANALREEEEHCLAVGMDAYATKPIALEALRALVEYWTAPRGSDFSAGDTQAGQLTSDARIDLTAIRDLVGDDQEVLAQLLNDFVSALTAGIPAIRLAADAGECEQVADRAHQLKSAARAFGARGLGELFEQLERERASGVRHTNGALLDQLEQEVDAVLDELAEGLATQRS